MFKSIELLLTSSHLKSPISTKTSVAKSNCALKAFTLQNPIVMRDKNGWGVRALYYVLQTMLHKIK